MNALVMALLMVMLGEPRLLRFGELLGHETAVAYSCTASALEQVWAECLRLVGRLR
jgi:hypothetical protein